VPLQSAYSKRGKFAAEVGGAVQAADQACGEHAGCPSVALQASMTAVSRPSLW
jgi:hypothetical protein